MPRLNKRKASAKQAESNRRNAQKSTGPRTPQGKQQIRLNALKHGLHSDPFVQGMLTLEEDPRAYYRLLEFDCEAPDLPQAELLQKGLDRAPESPAKFEKMLVEPAVRQGAEPGGSLPARRLPPLQGGGEPAGRGWL